LYFNNISQKIKKLKFVNNNLKLMYKNPRTLNLKFVKNGYQNPKGFTG